MGWFTMIYWAKELNGDFRGHGRLVGPNSLGAFSPAVVSQGLLIEVVANTSMCWRVFLGWCGGQMWRFRTGNTLIIFESSWILMNLDESWWILMNLDESWWIMIHDKGVSLFRRCWALPPSCRKQRRPPIVQGQCQDWWTDPHRTGYRISKASRLQNINRNQQIFKYL